MEVFIQILHKIFSGRSMHGAAKTGSSIVPITSIFEKFVLEEKQIISLDPPKPVSSSGIRIESYGITITLPETVSGEQLTAILLTLKQC